MEKEPQDFIKTRTIHEVSAKTLYEELTLAYGSDIVSHSIVQKWAKLFRDGRMEVEEIYAVKGQFPW
jgi:hypothetical protein